MKARSNSLVIAASKISPKRSHSAVELGIRNQKERVFDSDDNGKNKLRLKLTRLYGLIVGFVIGVLFCLCFIAILQKYPISNNTSATKPKELGNQKPIAIQNRYIRGILDPNTINKPYTVDAHVGDAGNEAITPKIIKPDDRDIAHPTFNKRFTDLDDTDETLRKVEDSSSSSTKSNTINTPDYNTKESTTNIRIQSTTNNFDEKVSIISPTSVSRKKFRSTLYNNFLSQTYPNKELVVMEDGNEPSPFWLDLAQKDPRVKYLHSSSHLSIGTKRNKLIEASTGAVVAQFDDDDFYHPTYIQVMLNKMQETRVDLVKLGTWLEFSGRHNGETLFGHFLISNVNHDNENLRWGYGFSYVFKRKCFEVAQFSDMDFGEDFEWLLRARDRGCETGLAFDQTGIVVKIAHGGNTSLTMGLESHNMDETNVNELLDLMRNVKLDVEIPKPATCEMYNNQMILGRLMDRKYIPVNNEQECCTMCAIDSRCTIFRYAALRCWKLVSSPFSEKRRIRRQGLHSGKVI